jgi:hypothetical protein
MEAAFAEVGTGFAEKIIARDYDAAREFLAPWLREIITAKELKTMVEQALGDLPNPARFELDGNSCGLEDLEVDEYSPPTKPLPKQITNDNYRKWMCITLQPDPEENSGYDACFDLWMALVDVSGSLKIGYLEPTDPD